MTDTQSQIVKITGEICGMLLDKNKLYGDAALSPEQIFSHSSPGEAIKIRIDDKLARIKKGAAEDDEDPILDLIGYLVLLLIAKRAR